MESPTIGDLSAGWVDVQATDTSGLAAIHDYYVTTTQEHESDFDTTEYCVVKITRTSSDGAIHISGNIEDVLRSVSQHLPEGVDIYNIAVRMDALVENYLRLIADNSDKTFDELKEVNHFTIQIEPLGSDSLVTMQYELGCLPDIAYNSAQRKASEVFYSLIRTNVEEDRGQFSQESKPNLDFPPMVSFHSLDPQDQWRREIIILTQRAFGSEREKWVLPLTDLYEYLSASSLYLSCGVDSFRIEAKRSFDQKYTVIQAPFTLKISNDSGRGHGLGSQADVVNGIQKILDYSTEGSCFQVEVLPVIVGKESEIYIRFTENPDFRVPDEGGDEKTGDKKKSAGGAGESFCTQFCNFLYSIWESIISFFSGES